jgi:pyruvate/2-oxoglutarate dehydrogenase complex dihydrolipoamide dehydrogenase (E3) component
VRNSEEFGITTEGFSVKMPAVRERKRRTVQGLVHTHLDLYRRSGAELIIASGRFVRPRTLEATLPDGTKKLLRGTNVVIGTGTNATVDSTPGLLETQPLTHVEHR